MIIEIIVTRDSKDETRCEEEQYYWVLLDEPNQRIYLNNVGCDRIKNIIGAGAKLRLRQV
jgi:hypothetical protein